jgi:fido (protein-threonine AMPylation protein)
VSYDAERLAKQKAIEVYEADRVAKRIRELRETPIRGHFDAAHLKSVHACLFQDCRAISRA